MNTETYFKKKELKKVKEFWRIKFLHGIVFFYIRPFRI